MTVILAIDSSFSQCSVAIRKNNSIFSEINPYPKMHNEVVIAMIDNAIKNTNIKLNEIEKIAVTIGPGSFTGLRVAVSVAQGFAVGLGVEVIAIASLDLIAYKAWKISQSKFIDVAMVAYSNFIYRAKYKFKNNGDYIILNNASKIDCAEEKLIAGSDFFCFGDAWDRELRNDGINSAFNSIPLAEYCIEIADKKNYASSTADRIKLIYL